jgi:hypothetical protein
MLNSPATVVTSAIAASGRRVARAVVKFAADLLSRAARVAIGTIWSPAGPKRKLEQQRRTTKVIPLGQAIDPCVPDRESKLAANSLGEACEFLRTVCRLQTGQHGGGLRHRAATNELNREFEIIETRFKMAGGTPFARSAGFRR